MNRRKFFKLLGISGVIAAFPALAKFKKPDYESHLTVFENTLPILGRANKYLAFDANGQPIAVGPQMTATEVIDRREEFAKSYKSSIDEEFIESYENTVRKVYSKLAGSYLRKKEEESIVKLFS